MREGELSRLMERAVDEAPPVQIEPEGMLVAGKRRVRQRRTAGAGMSIAALALAGAVWSSAGGWSPLGSVQQQTAPASTTWEVAQDETVELTDSLVLMDNGRLEVGPVVLHARADGTSAVDMTVDGEQRTVEGRGLFGGRAVAYPGATVTIVMYGVPQGWESLLIDGGIESTGQTAQVGGREVTFTIIRNGDTGGIPSDIVLRKGAEAAALSGSTVDTAMAGDVIAWRVADRSTWGLTLPAGATISTSDDAAFLRGGDSEQSYWAAQLPAGAQAARLDSDGTLTDAEHIVDLGDLRVAVGMDEDYGSDAVVEWRDASGTWHQLDSTVAPTPAPTLDLGDGTRAELRAEELTIVAEVEGTAYPTEIYPQGPTLVTLIGDGRQVYYVAGWDLVDPGAVRLGEPGLGGEMTWVEPLDATSLRLGDGTPVVALSIPEGTSPEKVGELRDGEVEEFVNVDATWRGLSVEIGDDGQVTPSRNGQELTRLDAGEEAVLPSWRDTDGQTLVVVEGEDLGDLVPVVFRGGSIMEAPHNLREVTTLEVDDRSVLAVRVDAAEPLIGLLQENSDQRIASVANYWQFLGAEGSAYIALGDTPEGQGLAVIDAENGIWSLVPTAGHLLGSPTVSRVDEHALWYRVDSRTIVVAAALSDPDRINNAVLVAHTAGAIDPQRVDDGFGVGLVWATVPLPEGASDPRDVLAGFDTDQDGEIDIVLTQPVSE